MGYQRRVHGESTSAPYCTRWEVLCLQESKMKYLVALLSVTLVSGAANPGQGDHGLLSISSMMVLIVMTRRTNSVIRYQKNKNMKNVMLLMNTMLITMVITRGQLMLENMDTTVVLSVKTRRSRSATSIPMRTLARSPRQLARRLLTPFTLRSVRKLSTLFVRKLTSSIITVSMLLVMNQMLLLDLLAFMKNTMERAMVMDMEDMEDIRFFL